MPLVIKGLLNLIGTLGLFLYSISRFGDGIQKIAGERLRIMLEKQTKNPISNILNGFGMAAALQSNLLTSGMISSLINAGLMGLLPAIWTMFGVNLGMTITAHLMSIKIGALMFVLLFCGYLFYLYGKKRTHHYLGQILLNLGLMYLSFGLFHRAFETLSSQPQAVFILRWLFTMPWLGFLLGMGLAALFRSSNTVVILTQGLVGVELALASTVFLSGACAIIIGANVGTTIINMFIVRDRLPIVKKTNWLMFFFNLSTGLIGLTLLPRAFLAVQMVSFRMVFYFQWFVKSVFDLTVPLQIISSEWFYGWVLAMAHSLFNFAVIGLWAPVIYITAKFGLPMLADTVTIETGGATYLDRRALQTPALALVLATREIKQMADITQGMLKSAKLAFHRNQIHLVNGIYRDECLVDDLQEQITFYLSALLSQNSLTEGQSHRLAGLLHIVSDIERVGDHANSIASLAEKKYQEQLQFSELALNEIELLFGKVQDLYFKACQAFSENKSELAKLLLEREESIDKLEEELRQNHIHRLNQGKCWPSSGVVYIEMLTNLQRISAHAANIASAFLEEREE